MFLICITLLVDNYILRCPTDVSAVNGASLELVSERKRKSANDYKKNEGRLLSLTCSHVVKYIDLHPRCLAAQIKP